MMYGVEFPASYLRNTGMPLGEAAIREAVFCRLREHRLSLSCLTLSRLALRYDQAAWWIKHEPDAYFCLQRLLDLRQAVASGVLSP